MGYFLLVIAAVMLFMMLGANLYILIYFQHEEDKNQAWAPKILGTIRTVATRRCPLPPPSPAARGLGRLGLVCVCVVCYVCVVCVLGDCGVGCWLLGGRGRGGSS